MHNKQAIQLYTGIWLIAARCFIAGNKPVNLAQQAKVVLMDACRQVKMPNGTLIESNTLRHKVLEAGVHRGCHSSKQKAPTPPQVGGDDDCGNGTSIVVPFHTARMPLYA